MRNFSRLSISMLTVATLLLSANLIHAEKQHTDPRQVLANEVGTWDAESKFWMSPDGKPMVSKAVETNTMLGDNWILSTFKSNLGDEPFEGRGQFGYDPVSKKYIGTWIDTMSPYLGVMEGTLDESNGVLTMMSTARDPQTGKKSTSKLVSSFSDDNHKKFEMFAPVAGKEGKWWKVMEVNYARRK